MNRKIKSCLFSAILLFYAPASLLANTALKTKENRSTNAPVIAIEKHIFHGGSIVEGDKINHIFKIKNRGEQQLCLTEITTDCSCTTVNSDLNILPGKSGDLKVTYDTAGGAGETFKRITVHSNDPKNPITVLEIGANILKRISIKPDRIFFSGIKGTPLEKSITIKAPDNRGFELKLLKSQLSNQIGFCVKKYDSNASYKLIFKNKAEVSESFRGRVFFETNLTERPRITIPVYSKITDQFQAIPQKIDFGKVNFSHPKTRPLTIRSHDGRPFAIDSVDAGGMAVSTKIIRLKKKGIYKIIITPAKPGKMETLLTVNIKSSEGDSFLKVPVVWN